MDRITFSNKIKEICNDEFSDEALEVLYCELEIENVKNDSEIDVSEIYNNWQEFSVLDDVRDYYEIATAEDFFGELENLRKLTTALSTESGTLVVYMPNCD